MKKEGEERGGERDGEAKFLVSYVMRERSDYRRRFRPDFVNSRAINRELRNGSCRVRGGVAESTKTIPDHALQGIIHFTET